jgi:type II secretion system protein H
MIPRPSALLPSSSGFSLIELMVVLALIGIMTALIIPQMKGTYEEALLRSTARNLMEAFKLASTRAVTLNQTHSVLLDSKRRHYFVQARARHASSELASGQTQDISGGAGEIDSRITVEIQKPIETEAPPTGEEPTVVSEDDVGRGNRVEEIAFYADGTADKAEVLLHDREGFRLVLRINPITAHVQTLELERQ